MKYSVNFSLWGSVFAVPVQIVDQHLKLCGAAQLKVLLALLRNGGCMELADIAAFLNLSAGDTRDALNYWAEAGVLRVVSADTARGDNPDAQKAAPVVAASPAPERTARTSVDSAPRQKPSPAEILEMAAKNTELKALLAEAEASLGKTLTSSDVSTLASLYDWAGIPADILLTVIEYCKTLGKTNLRYIEKVAVGWQEKGIDTFEKAERYIQQNLEGTQQTSLVKSAFGIYDRALTSKEADYVRSWFSEFQFDIPIIKLAYERSVENTGKVSFPYINKVLSNWHSQNISSPEQASREGAARRTQKPTAAKQASTYDIDEFEDFLTRTSPKFID